MSISSGQSKNEKRGDDEWVIVGDESRDTLLLLRVSSEMGPALFREESILIYCIISFCGKQKFQQGGK